MNDDIKIDNGTEFFTEKPLNTKEKKNITIETKLITNPSKLNSILTKTEALCLTTTDSFCHSILGSLRLTNIPRTEVNKINENWMTIE